MITNNTINFLSTTFRDKYSYIAVGDDDTPEAMTDVALGNELIREASTNSITTTTTLNDTSVFYKSFDFTIGDTFKEFGLLDANVNGNLFDRIVTPNIIVGNNQTMNVQFNVVSKEV